MQEKNIFKLLKCKNLDEFVTMYFGLSMSEKLSVINEKILIPKGTKLYRARKYEGIELDKEVDWKMPPEKCVRNMGRFNYKNRPVLYVSTMDFILPREIGLSVGDEYYLATYECKEDIVVGSFLKNCDVINCILHKVSISIENDDKLTENELFELCDVDIRNMSLIDIASDILSPLYINKLMKRDLYEVTNKMSDMILSMYPNGLRYCSAYAPIEASGLPDVITLDGEINGNYALTNDGAYKLVWIGSEKKKYTLEDSQMDLGIFISVNKTCDLSE